MSKIYGLTKAQQAKLEELERIKAEGEKQWRELLSDARAHRPAVLKALKAVPAEEVEAHVKAEVEKADAELREKYQAQWADAIAKVRAKAAAETRAEYGAAAAEHDALAAAAEQYGCSIDELLAYISSSQQVSYYKRNH